LLHLHKELLVVELWLLVIELRLLELLLLLHKLLHLKHLLLGSCCLWLAKALEIRLKALLLEAALRLGLVITIEAQKTVEVISRGWGRLKLSKIVHWFWC